MHAATDANMSCRLAKHEKLAGMPVPMSMRRVKQAQHSHQLLEVAAGTGGNTFSTAT